MYDELATTVYQKLSSMELEIVPAEAPAYGQKRTVPPNIDLCAARGILTYLDPARLRRLFLSGELTQADAESLAPFLQNFVHLEKLRLYVPRFDLALLTNVRAPLRSLEINSDQKAKLQSSALLDILSSFATTLEHLAVCAGLEFNSRDTAPVDMPHLRHFSLHVLNPISVASCFRSSPLEILDLGVSFPGLYGGPGSLLLGIMLPLQATLEVVLVDDAIFDSWPFRSEMSSMLESRRTHDIMLLLPGECEHFWWSDLRSPDFCQRAKTTGGIGAISDEIRYSRWHHDEGDEHETWQGGEGASTRLKCYAFDRLEVIDLYKRREYSEDEFFETFSKRTCSLFRRLEASGPHWSGALSDTQQTTYTNIFLRLPKVEDIAFCAVAEEAKKLVYPRLTHFFADAGLPRYAMMPNEIDNSRSEIDYGGLALLDPTRVTSVVVVAKVSEPVGFASLFVGSPIEILDLAILSPYGPLGNSLADTVRQLRDTLEIIMVDALLLDSPATDFRRLPYVGRGDGIFFITPLKEDPFRMKELRFFDEFQCAKKVGGIGIISDDEY
ncbi:hypothetical protein JCM10296v2_006308 [Rhodotorula toruloides]